MDKQERGIFAALKRLLELPETADLPLDDPQTTCIRKSIVQRKGFLRRLYTEWYGICRNVARRAPTGLQIEIGAGPGFLRQVTPNVIASDLMTIDGVQLVCSGEALPFAAGTVAALYLVDVLHHMPRPRAFFSEAARCLVPGGRLLMIEPHNTAWGRWVWRNLHHEPFDPDGAWEPEPAGPLSGGNSAMPWIVFHRDRTLFERTFPELRIAALEPFMPFSYLLSGGVSLRSLAPGIAYPVCRACERLLRPFNGALAMFCIIEIERGPAVKQP